MITPGGKIVGIEQQPSLVNLSLGNLQKSNTTRDFITSGLVKIIKGDGKQGYPQEAPYDAIHVGAGATHLPPALVDQLKSPGRMFIPVEDNTGGQSILHIIKDENGNITKHTGISVRVGMMSFTTNTVCVVNVNSILVLGSGCG
jgi:protein-L-isoaspartate(D-aspartate) O-methyltransferase